MSKFLRQVSGVLTLTLLAAFSGVHGAAAQGQTASLVADLNTTTETPARVHPNFLVAAGGKLFFDTTGGGLFQSELWATTGAPTDPELLCSGDCFSSPLAVLHGNLILFQSDMLWRSDGTRGGTLPLTDFASSSSYLLLGETLYFQRCDRPSCALYRSDGTASGTRPVDAEDTGYPRYGLGAGEQAIAGGKIYFLGRSGNSDVLRAYAGGSGGSAVVAELPGPPGEAQFLTGVGNRLFFLAPGAGGQPSQLWTSDGTPAGTRPVAGEPVLFRNPSPLHPAAGRVYFAADDDLHGRQIWTSDGTAAGTYRVTGLVRPDRLQDNDTFLWKVGPNLLFVALDAGNRFRLWTTAGTPESTSLLPQISANSVAFLYPLGDRALLGVEDSTGTQLWTTDGTAAGTGVFRGLCSGDCTLLSPPAPGTGGVYFAVRDPRQGTALYRTDGTEAGTHRLTQYDAPKLSAVASLLLAENGTRVSFFATPAGNPELWESDGTVAHRVQEIRGPAPSADPALLAAVGDRLFFTAYDGGARGLWQTRGSAETTQRIAPLATPAGLNVASSVATSRALFLFSFDDGVLWRTDGTEAGTVKLATFPGSLPSATVFADRPWFVLPSPEGSPAVWTSDGTPAGTVPAFSLPTGVGRLAGFTSLGDALYWSAEGPDYQAQLWKSDGTQDGTRQLTHFTQREEPREIVRAGSSVYFLVRDYGDARGALWKTDGTPAGTAVAIGADRIGRARALRELAGTLFFFGVSDTASTLFRSDGTPAGTAPLGTFAKSLDIETAIFAGRLYFVVDDGVHGLELWASDGTAAGTALVRDISPGPAGSLPSGLTVAGNRLFFSADDGVHGRELWESDGTAAGTRLVQDLAPELLSSSPDTLVATTDRLYFSADDGFHGRELWTLPLAGPTGCQPSDPHLCLRDNRFQVEIVWKDFAGHTGVGHAVALTPDTGYFWFFSRANVETVVKVLDARSLNNAFWVFYGALSNVEYTMTVTDTQTGLTRRYQNPAGHLASVGDTNGFGPLGAFAAETLEAPTAAPAWASARTDATAATGICVPGQKRLCLQGGRFAVTSVWKDFQGNTGTGTAVPLSGDTGYFWFFAPTNVEVVTKVLDGRALGGKFWFFYGALSNVEYTLTVTDTQTGAVKTYKNPSGQFGSVADTSAF